MKHLDVDLKYYNLLDKNFNYQILRKSYRTDFFTGNQI